MATILAERPCTIIWRNCKYRRYGVSVTRGADAREREEIIVASGYTACYQEVKGSGVYNPEIVGWGIFDHMKRAGWQLAEVVGLKNDSIRRCWVWGDVLANVQLKKTNLNSVGDCCWH